MEDLEERDVEVSESELSEADLWRATVVDVVLVRNTLGARELGVRIGRPDNDDADDETAGGLATRVGGWSAIVSRSSERGTWHAGQRPSSPSAPSHCKQRHVYIRDRVQIWSGRTYV